MIDKSSVGNVIQKYTPKRDPDIDKLFGIWYSLVVRLACSTAPGRIWS